MHVDHLGTPRLVTSDTGQVVSQHDYFPFGGEATPAVQRRHTASAAADGTTSTRTRAFATSATAPACAWRRWASRSLIIQQPQSVNFCPGSAATLAVSATGATAYQWQSYDGTRWNDITGATERFPGTSVRFPGSSVRFPGTSVRFTGISASYPGTNASPWNERTVR
jgi:hypothetical protein